MPEFLFKDDARFQALVDMGFKGEGLVGRLFEEYGHAVVALDGGAQLGRQVTKEAAFKRKRQTDLRCPACGLEVEVKTKSHFQIALSHSESRPFWSEHQPTDLLAIVTAERLAFYGFDDLRAARPQAVAKTNRDGEPYLQWPESSLTEREFPRCRSCEETSRWPPNPYLREFLASEEGLRMAHLFGGSQ